MTKKRIKYTREFKEEAVKLVTEQGYSCAEASRSLGVQGQLIGRWRKEQEKNGDQAFSGNGKLSEEQEEISRLRKQVKRLELEREILKKATAFFAKENT